MSAIPCGLYDLFSHVLVGVLVTTMFFRSLPRIKLSRWGHVGLKEVVRAERHLRLVGGMYTEELFRANVDHLVYV